MPLDTRPGKLPELEAKTGRSLDELIPETIESEGSVIRAAAKLEVNPNTLRHWLKYNGYEVHSTYVSKVVRVKSQPSY